jgi:hypothetical protein
MKSARILIIQLLLGFSFAHGADSWISVSPHVVVSRYSSSIGFNTGIGVGVIASFSFSRDNDLRLLGDFTNTTQPFDLILSSGSLDVSVKTLSAEYKHLLLSPFEWLNIATVVGGGWQRISVDEYMVSLGALGNRIVPSHSEDFGFLAGGVSLAFPIAQSVDVFLEPKARLFSYQSTVRSNLMILGGLSVSIL